VKFSYGRVSLVEGGRKGEGKRERERKKGLGDTPEKKNQKMTPKTTPMTPRFRTH
jgi:hypothetical protein